MSSTKETSEKKLDEFKFISQRMKLISGVHATMTKYRVKVDLVKSSGVDFKKSRLIRGVESLQFLEIMVVRHFRIEEVIVVKRLFFSKLVLPRFVVFLRSSKGDMNKTLRIKSIRSEEEMMKMRNKEDEWFK
ncbi:hypothetical protein Tco_0150787 [Tanacetum coccineum]